MQRVPARIGDPLEAVETPALVVDLDAFEHNLVLMANAVRGSGLALRPHAKSHKCPDIAKAQVARGAVGICCQKVDEAAAFVAAGIADILVTNEIVAPSKIARLAALVRRQLIRSDRTQFASDDGFRFRHLLIRDAAYRAMPKEQRADLHQRLVDERLAEAVSVPEDGAAVPID